MLIERFYNPNLLWLLLVLIPMVAYYIYRTREGRASLRISTVSGVEGAPRSVKYYLRHLPFVCRCVAVSLLVVALARPQNTVSGSTSTTEGIDIVIALDISSSMLAQDFQPDRITVAIDMAANFIVDRPSDRIGIVVFAAESYTQAPLTTDKATLLSQLGAIRMGYVEDGTAIGSGLATAVNRLKDSEAKSKVVILLTDGVNNRGQVSPLVAAELAQSYGIRVYTVGVGSEGMAMSPALNGRGQVIYASQQVEIDEATLQQIADKTEGQYFRATDNVRLKEVYDKINELERSKVDVESFTNYNELFPAFALWGLLILVLEALIQIVYLRRIP